MFHLSLFVAKAVVIFDWLVACCRKFWGWLTEPAAAIVEPDHRRQARLLAGLLVCLIPTILLAALSPLIESKESMDWPNEELYAGMVALVFLSLAYGLSRTRHFIWGAGLTTMTLSIALLGLIMSLDSLEEISYYIGLIILPLLVSSLFLSTLSTLAIIILSTVALLFLPLMTNLSWLEVIIGPLSFVLLVSISILAVTHHRNRLEEDRRARLAQSEERLRLVLNASGMGFWDWDAETHQIAWSEDIERLFGVGPAPFNASDSAFFEIIHPQDLPQFLEAIGKAAAEESRFSVEYRIIWPDKSLHWMSSRGKVIAEGQRLLGTIHDITERKNLETQLRQAQKMEFVGQLAGGVAHDFNNLLTVINGYTALALDQLEPQDSLYSDLLQVNRAGERAAGLTAQLLAFSRKQVLQPRPLSLNNLILNLEKMLKRLIGENINLEILVQPDLGQVKADPGQLEQVILNMVVNARDAMPEGGELIIQTRNTVLGELYAVQHPGLTPGPYVMLAVSDTGLGMEAETQSRIFEPFFTTKELGKGTGLGLATVYGIVKQSNGHIKVYSEIGHGTTFKIYLPRLTEPAGATPPEPQPAITTGDETILLVEDEEAVRTLAGRILRGYGYKVLEATDGRQALRLGEGFAENVHLLITDVIMPGGLNGRQLARRLTRQRPKLRALYMSGYTSNIIAKKGILAEGTAFLEKPFDPETLARKVREVLDAV